MRVCQHPTLERYRAWGFVIERCAVCEEHWIRRDEETKAA